VQHGLSGYKNSGLERPLIMESGMSHSGSDYGRPPCGVARPSVQFSQAIKAAMDGPGGFMNVLRALLLMMVPVVGQMAVNGWCAEIGQRIAMGHPQPTPPFEFNDFGYWIKRGVPSFVTNLVWGVGMAIIVQVVLWTFMLPVMALAMSAEKSGTEPSAVMIAAATLGGCALFACVMGVGILMNSALTVAELTENTSAPFALGRVMQYTRETLWLQLGTGLLFAMVASAMSIAGMLAFFVGFLFIIPVLTVAWSVLRVQMYQVNLGRGGSQLVIHPPTPCPTEQAQMAGYLR
jgi:hypothetical protein